MNASPPPLKPEKPKPEKACPVCRKPATEAFRPFCSKRCADVDLNRWLVGAYAVPTEETEEDEAQGIRRDADEG
jgi:hypothetical protein